MTYTESNTQEDTQNLERHSKFNDNQVWTETEHSFQYAAIRDGVYYSASSYDGEEVYPSREKIAESSGMGTTTEAIAQRNFNAVMDIASLDGTGVFDVFSSDSAIAAIFAQETANGVTTTSIGAYDEDTESGFNYSYTITLTIDDQKQTLTSVNSTIRWAFDDYWDFSAHAPKGSAESDGNAYRSTVRVKNGDLVYGTYDAAAPLLFDFDSYYVTKITEAHIYAEGDGMGVSTSGEPDQLHVGDYLTWEIVSYEPETATDVDAISITGSSDFAVVTTDQYGYSYQAVGEGECDIYLGTPFNPQLGKVHVTVSGASADSQNTPYIMDIPEQEGYEILDDPQINGRFTIELGDDYSTFTANTNPNTKAPYSITGNEIKSDNPDIAFAQFYSPEEFDGQNKVNILIAGKKVGKTIISIPNYMGNGQCWKYEVDVVEKAVEPMLGDIVSSTDGFEESPDWDYNGILRVPLAGGTKKFPIQVTNEGYSLTGNEVTCSNTSVAEVCLEEGTPDDGLLDIVITPKSVGTADLIVPVYGGLLNYTYQIIVE